jgi:hypothetical protein
MNLKNMPKDKLKIVAATAVFVLVFITIMVTTVIGVTSQIDTSTPDEIAYVQVVTTKPAETTELVTVETTTEPEIVEDSTEDYVTEVEYELEETYVEDDEYVEENDYSTSCSDYELDLLARTIYQEAGICSEYCQWLVGSTVLNLADERGGVESVVLDYNTFNVSYKLYDATPSNLSYAVAKRLLLGDRDYSVKAFRTDYYHSFGTPYTNTDNVYFSTY